MEFIPEVVVSVRKDLRLERYKYEEGDITQEKVSNLNCPLKCTNSNTILNHNTWDLFQPEAEGKVRKDLRLES